MVTTNKGMAKLTVAANVNCGAVKTGIASSSCTADHAIWP